MGDRLIVSGLDHYIYCLDKRDGSLIWKFKTGFEVDCSAAVIDGRVYFGSEDGFFYSLNLDDGTLIYKTERLGSMEGSFSVVDGRAYIGTEQGDLFCLNLLTVRPFGSRASARILIRRPLSRRFCLQAAENGVVYCFRQDDGELVWKYQTLGGIGKERNGIWASPIVKNGRVYIGSNNGYLHA